MTETNYAYEGELEFQPSKVTEYQGTNKFSFKLKGNDTWHSFYQQDGISDENFKKMMEDDFKRGFKLKFNGALMGTNFLLTDYEVVDRTEAPKKAGGSFQREDPKLKIATFSISYAKDLIIAGKADLADLEVLSERIKNHMDKLMK